jgi:membrane protein implicated in regulation of membrane protease activity
VVLIALGAIGLGVGIRQQDGSRLWLVLGSAALVSGMLGLFGAPVSLQLGVLVAATVAGALLSWRWHSLVSEGNTLPAGAGSARLVGMTGEVVETIPTGVDTNGWDDMSSGDRPAVRAGDRDPVRPVGRVRVVGEIWRAQSLDGTEVASGSTVTVVAVRGTRLVVAPAGATDESVQASTDSESVNSGDEAGT